MSRDETRKILRVPVFHYVVSLLHSQPKHTYRGTIPCWQPFPSPDFGYCPKAHDMLGNKSIWVGSSSILNGRCYIEELEEGHNQNTQDIQKYSPSRHSLVLQAEIRSFSMVSEKAASLAVDSLFRGTSKTVG